jgi:molybdopterin biosynthesis enzyme
MMSLDEHRPAVVATLDGDVGAHTANLRFVLARLRQEAGTLIATPQADRRSNLIAGLARADALVEVPPGSALTAGMACRVRVLRGVSGN